MVFIQQKYEEALVDLYFYRAEASGSSRNAEDRAIMDEAIAGTYWVAQQNGVSYTEEQIQAKFLEQLDEQLEPVASEFKSRFADIDEYIDEYTVAFVSALKKYYLDPKLETFEEVIEITYEFDQSSENMVIYWSSFFHNIVAPISEGLAISFTGHGRENEDKFTMAPQIISPVEISQAEQELVFRG